MRNHFILLLLFHFLLSAPLNAQKRRSATPKAPALPVLKQARLAMEDYDFDRATDLLSTTIAAQKKKRKPTEDIAALERLQEMVQRLSTKLYATERIVFIDSVVCPKDQFLRAIRLTRESGRLDTYASTYHMNDVLGATLYENELANKRYLAIPMPLDKASSSDSAAQVTELRLAVSDKIGENWASPTLLTGLSDDDTSQNYPFLLSDGVTLYYAATGPESIGGYDIFVSRSDGEDGSFLTPENVGFPLNSTANDYLLAIDELAQMGWLVTDRRQPEGQVCIYNFIPNESREVYGDETDEVQLRKLARLTSIRDTWPAATGKAKAMPDVVKASRQRLDELRAGKIFGKTEAPDFIFVIDDNRTYTSLADFQSSAARQKMQTYLQQKKSIETDAIMLQRLRDNYVTTQASQRTQISETIRRLEANHYSQLQQISQMAKDIRNAEITHE